MNMKNALVKIKPEWDGDETIFRVVEDNIDRLFISPIEWIWGGIVPTELVTLEMIELV